MGGGLHTSHLYCFLIIKQIKNNINAKHIINIKFHTNIAIYFYFKTYNVNNAPVECLAGMLENHTTVVHELGVYKWKKWHTSPTVGTEIRNKLLT